MQGRPSGFEGHISLRVNFYKMTLGLVWGVWMNTLPLVFSENQTSLAGVPTKAMSALPSILMVIFVCRSYVYVADGNFPPVEVVYRLNSRTAVILCVL